MSSLIEKLQYTKQTKLEIKEAISEKGSTCDTDCFREYPDRIRAISTSSGDSSSGGSSSGGSSSGGSSSDSNSGSEVALQEITIQENGVYTPDSNYDGFSKVIVSVAVDSDLPRAEEVGF